MNYSILKQLLQLNSYSLNKEGVNKKMQFIKDELAGVDLDWQVAAGDRFADLHIARSKRVNPDLPMIGLVLHIDTVHKPEVEILVREEGDKLYGSGAEDMQGSVFVVMSLLKDLQAKNELQNLVVIFNTCEEFGSPEFKDEMRELAEELDYALGFEPTEMPPGGHDLNQFVLANSRKGIFTQVIGVTGPGGHSGMLTKRSERFNAISQAAKMISAIDDLADYNKETSVNIESISGGQDNTIIAMDCQFRFDVRFRLESERERMHAEIARILKTPFVPGTKVEIIEEAYELPSWQPNDGTESLVEAITAAAGSLGLQVKAQPRGGWSDICNLYHFNPQLKVIDGLGPHGHGEHTSSEYVHFSSLQKSLDFSLSILDRLLAE